MLNSQCEYVLTITFNSVIHRASASEETVVAKLHGPTLTHYRLFHNSYKFSSCLPFLGGLSESVARTNARAVVCAEVRHVIKETGF